MHPRFRLSDRVWSKNAYSVLERAVAEVVARHMNDRGVAFPGYSRIATMAGVSSRSVTKAMRVLVFGDESRGLLPLLARKTRHTTSGKPKGFEYELVENPAALVKARGEKSARQEGIEKALRMGAMPMTTDEDTRKLGQELHRQSIADQKAFLEGEIDEKEYEQRKRSIDTQVRMLARAVEAKQVGPPTLSGGSQ